MIDLTKKTLPNTITVNGKVVFLNTDYRVWLEFFKSKNVKLDKLIKEVDVVLVKDDYPELDKKLKEFLYNPNEYPKYDNEQSEKSIDYYLDGEYIWVGILEQYGIDILEVNMHWHKFKAMVDSLRVGIIGHAKTARTYKKPSKKETSHEYWMKEKRAWSFRQEMSKEDEEMFNQKVKEFEDYFDGR